MDKSFNLWLIRTYAIIILILVFADILEGAALKLVLVLVSFAIIVQSFMINKTK